MFTTKQSFDVHVLVNDLLKANEDLVKNNSVLSAALADLTVENKRYREKCEELAAHIQRLNEIPTQFSSGPLWMSEEEEDARYRHASGEINGEMLRKTLTDLGLDPDITATVE